MTLIDEPHALDEIAREGAEDHSRAELRSAEDDAAYGWINRALPAEELDGFVAGLARNIAALPDGIAQAANVCCLPLI
ncbi:hypothetical protein OZ411_15460 [Bradyrhizobium sp. Arg237L]|uniref:hypothetical protein n=1 Tax=Bradyrhizobium sp. Arg237L TaxID=3003352 RepID=UPI00249E8CFA|nr:hypothetical protein [Bradyrhizobium sp. Arg237L]MDI4234206.1 hypothetical protein [Bradyrhizobium sp. Arg237L]